MGRISMNREVVSMGVLLWVVLSMMALPAGADVFNMPNGLTNLETVPVGNPGNAPDMRPPLRGPWLWCGRLYLQHRQVRGDGRAVLPVPQRRGHHE